MDRRQFILTGIALGAASSLGLYGWQLNHEPADNRELVLSAILPALLYAALPKDTTAANIQVKRTITAVTDFMPLLALRQQQELKQLFNLLAGRLTQLALTGHVTALPELSINQRLAMLERWRDSYLSLLQQAYHGLRELLYGAYYGQPEHWLPLNYSAPRFR